jgi:phage shock protein A
MEAHHPNAAVQGEDLRQTLAKELAAFVAEKTVLMNTKDQLRERNAELVEELEEMRAMVEVLKGQISRRKGLVSDPRASPTLG